MLIRRRLHPAAVPAALLSGLVLLSGCTLPGDGGQESSGGSAPDARVASPFGNPDGTRPGLAPVTAKDEQARARTLIGGLATKGRGPRTGYARDAFGHAWLDKADGVPFARNGCDTRNDLLRRDGRELRLRDGSDCVVVAMTLDDPYTGTTIDWRKRKAAEVQIDHVVPLSYAWQMGASRWPAAQRERLANDPLNLLPVQGRANSAKGDSGPASWLPPARPIRCAYAVRFAQVAEKYELPVTAADRTAMLRQCGG
ncbi:HNH endonuclease family protein [Streptomyces sp. NPDC127049]|uniref:HNH endonuclease family protein n=1 Tax=Streptomyces sp. NPDC127049 TaxID=3347118 RepID=UPI00366602BE